MNKLLASMVAVAFALGTVSAFAADEMKKEETKVVKKAPKKAKTAAKKSAKKEMKKEETK